MHTILDNLQKVLVFTGVCCTYDLQKCSVQVQQLDTEPIHFKQNAVICLIVKYVCGTGENQSHLVALYMIWYHQYGLSHLVANYYKQSSCGQKVWTVTSCGQLVYIDILWPTGVDSHILWPTSVYRHLVANQCGQSHLVANQCTQSSCGQIVWTVISCGQLVYIVILWPTGVDSQHLVANQCGQAVKCAVALLVWTVIFTLCGQPYELWHHQSYSLTPLEGSHMSCGTISHTR